MPARVARRFQRLATGIDRAFPSTEQALAHLGYVQIDPLNICGRMHDLILRNRVIGYREGDLMAHIHGDTFAAGASADTPKQAEARTAFEHHLPHTHVLVAFPLEAWPHLRTAMQARARRPNAWSGRLTPTEKKLAPQLLDEIRRRGPSSSDDFADKRPARRRVWGASSLVKSTLQKLFFHGELLIAQRDHNRRRYDLPERVLPRRIAIMDAADAADTRRWLILLKLRQRRLATLQRDELPVVHDAVQRVDLPGCPPVYCLIDDLPLLDACAAADTGASAGPPPVRLLAPLDPLIYNRRLTAQLWQFDYIWEAYTPAVKRVRGHYALPVLVGTELVGHVEPKADRATGRLVVASRAVRRGYATTAALDELAAWLGLRR